MNKKNQFTRLYFTVLSLLILSGCISKPLQNNHVATKLILKKPYTLSNGKHLLHDFPAIDAVGNLQVVIEIPAGSNQKWEVNKATGDLKWEFKHGKPRIVQYLSYPGNYGMVPQTLLAKEAGGDGDPLDVLILGSAVARGSIVSVRPIGVLKLLDEGEQDDKIIAVLLNSELESIQSIKQLNQRFRGITEIIQIWFSNYKGPGRLQSKGFKGREEAKKIINTAIETYQQQQIKNNQYDLNRLIEPID
jgi:inorganic pyrophosphatase